MYDKQHRNQRNGVWEQVITALVTLAAAIVAGALGASDKWLTAIFATIVTFGGMLSFFRSRWPLRRFWLIIGILFLFHLVLTWLIFGVALRQRADIGLISSLPFILLECYLIYHFVRLAGGPGLTPRK